MNTRAEEMRTLLRQAGYPAFPLDGDGHIQPGPVIKYYREQMTYIDPNDGKEKHWTQKDLATRLGLAEITVTLMETQNKGLDSIERRQTIATILRIPPALLGLASLDQLAEMLKNGQSETLPSNRKTSKRITISHEEMDLYRSALDIYRSKYIDRTVQTSMTALESWIRRISKSRENADATQQSGIPLILWDFHVLAARIYSYDLCDYKLALEHLDEARELAEIANRTDLRAMSFCLSGNFYLLRGKPFRAKIDFDASIELAKAASPQIKGNVYGYASRAMTAEGLSGMTYAQKLLDQAERYTDASHDNDLIIGFRTCDYLKHRAKTLVEVKRYGKALEFLDDAEEELEPSDKRLLEYLNILRAECFIKQRKPEYDRATVLLKEVLEQSKSIREQYHINCVARLFKELTESSYGNSPDVIDLSLMLRNSQ